MNLFDARWSSSLSNKAIQTNKQTLALIGFGAGGNDGDQKIAKLLA